MASSSGSVFSQTLQEITTTKLEELAKKRDLFEKQKAAATTAAESKQDALDMLTALADGVKQCFSITTRDGKVVRGNSGQTRLETELQNLDRFIDQARFDPSVSAKIIQQWKDILFKHLDVQSLKYQYADLYGKLTVEWLTSSKPKAKAPDTDAMDMLDDFEELSTKAKIEARRKWEEGVFEEAPVDQSVILEYLKQLFSAKETQQALKILRQEVSNIENVLAARNQFNHYSLQWIIKGLLASDLLTDEKRQVLRDFQSNDVILTELADVLNMRMSALQNWSWGSEVAVEQRRQLNGRYNIYMHEDLLQAIFLQYIGVQWSVEIKRCLKNFVRQPDVWNTGHQELTPIARQRREWYLPTRSIGLTVERVRSACYEKGFFISQLLDDVNQDVSIDEGDEEADFEGIAVASKKRKAVSGAIQMPQMAMRAKQTARKATVAKEMRVMEDEKEESDEDMGFGLFDDGPDLSQYKPKNPMDAKQRILHLLSTEILVKTRINGDITCFRSQFDAWNPSLPHVTIRTVLAFFGVSDRWLKFFSTFLEAPLKFLGEDEQPRLRKRGTPGAHVLSDVFGEMVLFCLDFAINQDCDGQDLWRMHDDFWYWSSNHNTCVKAWKLIENFNKVMGSSLNENKSAAVRTLRNGNKTKAGKLDKCLPNAEIRWGMIYLDPDNGVFTIDREMVDKHIEELRRQLKVKERSIFAWVQAYSTYASVFFTSNFGKPANCFGREHLDMMLSSHERIQKTLFSGSDEDVTSVVDWLKKQIEQRFGVKDVPDGYLFFPTELGGLDVKSPFINLLQIRDSVTKSPMGLLDEFQEAEREAYEKAKKTYLEKKAWQYPKRDKEYRPDDPEQFMPFEEYIQFREELRYEYKNQLADVYEVLLKRPVEDPLETAHEEVLQALNRLRASSTITSWYSMDPYWKWVTMLYGPEMLERFGGFDIVDAGLLPMGMVGLFRSGRVSWQE
ncbi:hypothetical protein H2198_009422 [Neophaeococcomyces mojaviensis]|uniref:Uncharacterized protein n=1 Tax=Neophaeococcomyces mojaviensis TaxID=3383035 RepID=A0ACC2ZUQ8_9EURO|nr:hypothetical protein H2198_009422 [Knufia sp. JES_112]